MSILSRIGASGDRYFPSLSTISRHPFGGSYPFCGGIFLVTSLFYGYCYYRDEELEEQIDHRRDQIATLERDVDEAAKRAIRFATQRGGFMILDPNIPQPLSNESPFGNEKTEEARYFNDLSLAVSTCLRHADYSCITALAIAQSDALSPAISQMSEWRAFLLKTQGENGKRVPTTTLEGFNQSITFLERLKTNGSDCMRGALKLINETNGGVNVLWTDGIDTYGNKPFKRLPRSYREI